MKALLYVATTILLLSAAASVSYFLFTLDFGPFVLLPQGFQDILAQNDWLRFAIPAVAVVALVVRLTVSAALARRERQLQSA